ncbi:hypothetical protein ACWD5V_32975 [Streptomyces sp. NPDC002523]
MPTTALSHIIWRSCGLRQARTRSINGTRANRKLERELAQLRPLADHVQELQQDLAAARTSLRQMIRGGNQRDST